MFLYLLTQTENVGYDTYDSCVVAAENSAQAMRTHPDGPEAREWNDTTQKWHYSYGSKEPISTAWSSSWVTHINKITCEEIGVAAASVKPGVVIASFNAG